MNNAENSKSLSVSTACIGTGLFEGSQVANHFTCASATPARGIDPITWHAMKANSVAALGRARMALTALFRFFFADADETASTRLRTGPSIDRRWQQEDRPKIAATVAIENVQSDDEPQAVV
jgi:hypothetical protein